jgi:putative aldouronate transport system substrate-binding protein
MKKLLSVFLFLAVAVSAFAGGSQGGSGASGAAAPGKTSRVGAKGSLPLVTNNATLTLFIAGGYDENLTSFDVKDNLFTQRIVKDTGLNLVVTASTAADAQEKLNIMLNTGDYPDMINPYRANADMEYYAKQGVFIALDPYAPTSFPTIKSVFDTSPAAWDKVRGSDGKMYALPETGQCLHCDYSYGRVWYYMPWIRDNKRQPPTTTAELTEYLRWVKNSDLNKNGKKDEVGIVFQKGDLRNVVSFITKAFMPWVQDSRYFGLCLDNSKNIIEQYRDKNFRASLVYMAGLYKEDLIVQDSFSMTNDQLQAITRQDTTIAAVLGSSWYNNIFAQQSDKYMEYFRLKNLKDPSGKINASNGDPWALINTRYYITNKCKDPELAIAFYDYMATGEIVKTKYGPKGVFWDDADPGTLGYDGTPAHWKWLINFGSEPLNSHWGNGGLTVLYPWLKAGLQVDDAEGALKYLATGDPSLKAPMQTNQSYAEFMWFSTSNEMTAYALPNSVFIPPILYNAEDQPRIADIKAVLDPYIDQAMVEFITGVRNINSDAEWNSYLVELDRLGSPELVKIMQKYVKQ